MWLKPRAKAVVCETTLSPSGSGRQSGARCAVRDAVAHHPDRRQCRRRSYESSDLILNLNEPNKLGDVSLVQAAQVRRRVVVACTSTPRAGAPVPRHGATTANAQPLHRLRGANTASAACSWKAGTRAGTATGSRTASEFSFTQPYPDFDLEAARRVREIEGRAPHRPPRDLPATSRTTRRSSATRSTCTRGSASTRVKTGYVADAGRNRAPKAATAPVRYEWHDGQLMSRHHLKVVTEAREAPHRRQSARADQGHGPAPHVSELGLARRRPRHGVQRLGRRRRTRPSTRRTSCSPACSAGPMDFTPGVLSAQRHAAGSRFQSHDRQAARALRRDLQPASRWRRTCRSTTSSTHGAFQFIREVPDRLGRDDCVLNGEVGDYVDDGAQGPNSDDWYVGGVDGRTSAHAGASRSSSWIRAATYTREIYRDGDGADLEDEPACDRDRAPGSAQHRHLADPDRPRGRLRHPLRRSGRLVRLMVPGGGVTTSQLLGLPGLSFAPGRRLRRVGEAVRDDLQYLAHSLAHVQYSRSGCHGAILRASTLAAGLDFPLSS